MRVPNHVPDSANLTPPYPTKPDEASAYAAENERQRANHNPRVGGSSPSSGTTRAPAGDGRGLVAAAIAPETPRLVAARCRIGGSGSIEPCRVTLGFTPFGRCPVRRSERWFDRRPCNARSAPCPRRAQRVAGMQPNQLKEAQMRGAGRVVFAATLLLIVQRGRR